tara:strand:- start:640 stop:1089 length:450 start_codon:yes stop_codon:yes gene_type:complete
MKSNIKVYQVKTEKEQSDCFDIRLEVFVQEQGVPSEEELDNLDQISFHAIAYKDNYPIATGRVIPDGNINGTIGRMAVRQKYRRFGVGGMVLNFLEQIALDKGIKQITLNAQEYVKKFYNDHGYKEEGYVFLEAGIPHVTMVKTIFKEM